MGKTSEAMRRPRAHKRVWFGEMDGQGSMHRSSTRRAGGPVKDYGHMFRNDPRRADGPRVGAFARRIRVVCMICAGGRVPRLGAPTPGVSGH